MDDVSKALGEMTAEVRNVGTRLDRLETSMHGRQVDIERRIRSLELWRSLLTGAGAALGGAIGWLFAR